jgi:hypothetical protein
MTANDQVLLQAGYLIMSSPVLEFGFVLLMKLRTLLGFVRQAHTVADSNL